MSSVASMLPDWPPPQVWRPYGTEPLPSRAEALALPLKAFPGWFLSIRCGRCGETRMVNETQTPWQDVRLVYVLRRLRHADCGGEAASVELHSHVEGGHRRHRLRRIVLRDDR